MKNKPFVFILLLLIVLPIPVTHFLIANGNQNNTTINDEHSLIGEKINHNFSKIQAQNILHDGKWIKPLSSKEVLSNLIVYNKRAMISFFTVEEKDLFIKEAINQGIHIDCSLKSIPAIIISYENNNLRQINFQEYDIKYTYDIGSYEYTTPMNVDMDFPGLVNLAELREALEIDAIHELGYTGHDVNIAILDSGVNVSNVPALNGYLNYNVTEEGFAKVMASVTPVEGLEDQADFSGHGTHIASILAGNGNYTNSKGKTIQTDDYGIAPDARIISVKVLDKTGYGKDEWLITGLDAILSIDTTPGFGPDFLPDIISASLTSVTFAEIGDPIEELVYLAASRNILFVASAGNYGPSGASVGAPAIWDYVISVGASDGLNKLAIFTSKGLNQNLSVAVDILAPGVAIQGSNAEDGRSKWVSGTSVSAPIVSGVLALLVGAYPGLNIHKYEAALLGTADILPFPVVYQGNGMINPYAAYTNLTVYHGNDMSVIVPRYMDPENEYYYECVAGESTTFHIKLISSFTGTIQTNLDLFGITDDENYVQIANLIDVYEGWNHINFTVSIPIDTEMRYIQGYFGLTGYSGIVSWPGSSQASTFVFKIITRYLGGTVLFDISHENDTANRWFDASSPYGTHMHLARLLKDRGFRVRIHTSGTYDFDEVNILVISDPELNFTTQEIEDIYNFVANGGSLLFLIDSIRFIDAENVETSPLISSNYFTCKEFLYRYNITLWEDVPINVPFEVYTTEEATMLTVDSFMWWGKMLHFPTAVANDSRNIVLARMPEITIDDIDYTFDVAVAEEVGDGRIMVFGSGYPFTDHGLLPDSLETAPSKVGLDRSYRSVFNLDANNLQLVNDTFEWLISTHRPRITFNSYPEKIMIRYPIDMEVQITLKNGTIYTAGGATLSATLLRPGHIIQQVELQFNSTSNKFEFSHTFTEYGEHFLFVPLQFSDHTPTDGRIRIFNNVPLWDTLPLIENIAVLITAIIIVSIILIPVYRSRFRKKPLE